MLKRPLHTYLPDAERIKQHKQLRLLQRFMSDPNLWHFNRKSVSLACAIGLFCAFLPIPMHTLIGTAFAIAWRAHLALTIALIWVNNPFTLVPMYYASYRLGLWMLGTPAQNFSFEWSWQFFSHEFMMIWKPLLLGCLIAGLFTGLVGYGLVQWWYFRKDK